MRSLRVSVALCTYNGERYLPAQLASILNQSRRPDEIVVSDDASEDATSAILERFAGVSEVPVRIVRGPQEGVTANFQSALQHTTGDLVALCDQDDVWHPERLARAVAVFDRDPDLLLLHGDARLVDANGEPLGHTLFEALRVPAEEWWNHPPAEVFATYLRRNLATGATTTFRRDLLSAAVPMPKAWVHDEWLAILAAAIGRVSVLREPLVDYRQHGANEIGIRVPTIGYLFGRLFSSRGDRLRRLAIRARILSERLALLGAPTAVIALAEGKAEFELKRASYSKLRLARVPAVLGSWRSGAYRAFSSQGLADVARDLLQRR